MSSSHRGPAPGDPHCAPAADVEPSAEESSAEESSAEAGEFTGDVVTVVRVVDGDTIVVRRDGEDERVRLLNVDTPETKHPDEPVECLGPETTEYLESQLSRGDEVRLEYDEERTDRYDRTLAGVYKGDALLNAEIARNGYGTAVVYEPNRRFYPEVLTAQEEAEDSELGLFDPDIECTVPAVVAEGLSAVDALPSEPDTSDPAATAEAAAAALVLTGAGLAAVELVTSGDHPHLSVADGSRADDDEDALDSAEDTAEELRSAAEDLEAEQKQAAEERTAEQQRTDEEQTTEDAPAPAPSPSQPAAPAPTPAPDPPRSSAPAPAPAPSTPPAPAPGRDTGGGNSGGTPNMGPQDRPAGYHYKDEPTSYTGPRCFLPGGQWWKPC